VKTILDYLRTVSQPDNNDALSRIINTPSRRIGENTIKALLEEADISKITLWTLILGIIRGQRSTKVKLPKQTEQSLSTVVNIILTAQKRIADREQRCSIVQLIQFVIDKTNYETWLEEHHADTSKGRWDNVQELITQAGDLENLLANGYEDDSLPVVDGLGEDDDSDVLSRFLANVALASEIKKDEDEEAPTAQVTISTIHSAKGLEWPVVFIPGAYQGSIPHSRAEDSNEERRLLYVAMTRAKSLLYMSFPVKNSQGETSTLSPFLDQPCIAPLLNERGPSFRSSTIQSMAQILRRPLPSAESITKSSSTLRSREDNMFPLNDDDQNTNEEAAWNWAGKPAFTKGQRAPTRQRVELGRSTSLVEEGSRPNLGRAKAYPTTMDQASRFMAASTTMNTTFVSAGSHLQALTEQSVNSAVGTMENSDRHQNAKQKSGLKKAPKGLDGKGTLLGFFGKTQPQVRKRPAPVTDELDDRKSLKVSSQSLAVDRDINQPRPIIFANDPNEITPALASHRLQVRKDGIRPKQSARSEQHTRNDYVFLSSSPPRSNPPIPDPEDIPEKPAGLIAKPPLLPLIRPATTMHTTTVSIAQDSLGLKRTLGVKRSLAGWPSGNGQSFRPPTMKSAK
jgi:DNA helicase-2/ATP-dependent DNA helicase PcrA